MTRVYLHPGHSKARAHWPAVTVGKTPSVEDAVFCDVDNDGAVDVISSCEGEERSVLVNWAPKQFNLYLCPDAWTTDAIAATVGKSAWMFSLPMQIDGKNGADIVVGSKEKDALVGWLQAPKNPRDMAGWKLHLLYKAGWIMSLVPIDVDGDRLVDLIVSDRLGNNSGALWLENPGPKAAEGKWPEHRIGASGREIMFLDVADFDSDGRQDVIAAVKPDEIHWFRCPANPTGPWPSQIIKVAFPEGVGRAKGVRIGDIDNDGKPDIVYSCEHATPPKRGLVWLGYDKTLDEGQWVTHDISGPEGIKFDRIELLDVDGDDDLDVLSSEERHERNGIGVFWYENPLNSSCSEKPISSFPQRRESTRSK